MMDRSRDYMRLSVSVLVVDRDFLQWLGVSKISTFVFLTDLKELGRTIVKGNLSLDFA